MAIFQVGQEVIHVGQVYTGLEGMKGEVTYIRLGDPKFPYWVQFEDGQLLLCAEDELAFRVSAPEAPTQLFTAAHEDAAIRLLKDIKDHPERFDGGPLTCALDYREAGAFFEILLRENGYSDAEALAFFAKAQAVLNG